MSEAVDGMWTCTACGIEGDLNDSNGPLSYRVKTDENGIVESHYVVCSECGNTQEVNN